MFDLKKWLFGEFGTAFLADLAYGTLSGQGKPQQGSGAAMAGAAMGSKLRPHLFGLGRNDEVAFAEVLSKLDEVKRAKIISRIKSLGDPDVADTPEARSFRQSLVTLPDLEARIGVLEMIADLPESKWQDFVNVTGFAKAGHLIKALREFFRMFEISAAVIGTVLGVTINTVKNALILGDEKAADRLLAAAETLDNARARVRLWKEEMRERRLSQKRGWRSWLWPWGQQQPSVPPAPPQDDTSDADDPWRL